VSEAASDRNGLVIQKRVDVKPTLPFPAFQVAESPVRTSQKVIRRFSNIRASRLLVFGLAYYGNCLFHLRNVPFCNLQMVGSYGKSGLISAYLGSLKAKAARFVVNPAALVLTIN
jgi:hypothetical protein